MSSRRRRGWRRGTGRSTSPSRSSCAPTANASPRRLLQLAANAVNHTEEGGTITFGATEDATHVHLWVRDDGPGVPPEIATDIFDRFTRGSTEGGGFGLGLSIVGAIAEAHGGTIVLDPTEVGAQFRMILPKGHQ